MNIKYILKNKSIYYRFRVGRKLSVLRKLPFEIQENDWSPTKQCAKPKNLQPINAQLVKFKSFLLDEINLALTNEVNVNLEWVKQKQHAFFNTSETNDIHKVYLYDYLVHYIRIEKPISTNFNIIKKHISKTTRIIDIDLKWFEEFSKNKLKEYAESTIGKHIQQIKQVLKHAESNEIRINKSAFDFKIKQYTTINTYLTINELEMIFNYEFKSDYLNNAKRLFLVGCTTGLRVSDLMRIKEFHLENDFIELVTQKTKQSIIIPLDPRVIEFIPLLRPISQAKFNKYIKKVCQIVGLNEPLKGYIRGNDNKRKKGIYPKYQLITSHSMRRSFASNLYGKVPTVVIMAITGHTTEKTFLTYIKKPQRDFAEQLKNFYSSGNRSKV